jgi:hypothetical protein
MLISKKEFGMRKRELTMHRAKRKCGSKGASGAIGQKIGVACGSGF